MADLPTLYAEILATLAELEAVTMEPRCDQPRLASVRYRLSRANGIRRRVVEELCTALVARSTTAEAGAYEAIRQASVEARIRSTIYVGQWSIHEAAANWSSYRVASARMRTEVRAQIRKEQALLCLPEQQAA